ncbi:MATE family efflux transporter [Roseburia hominis]|uniref:MATE family efflux transporter n=1 Tax=Roseburia hominis TaxID=301301 RepID=UPI00399BAE15
MEKNMQADLSKKDEQFREFSLNGPMWRVVLYVGFPLALYESLNQLFKILDTMMASHIGASAVSAVAYLSQINMMISAVGTGLAVGASIKVSLAYGAGDFMLVKKRVSTMFAMCGALGIAILLVLVPFTPEFLRLMNTPEEFIADGSTYFRLELFGMVITFFNNVYIAIERARGNSKRILILNTAVIVVKLGLTAWFVYGLGGGINMISCATIISQSLLLLAACINMNQKGNAFGFSLRAISIKKEVICPMLTLSFPVIVERIAFAVGKVIVNSMSTVYGSWTVGALGISNNIGGITTNPQNGFQEGGSSIISQNLGAGRPKRALLAFRWVLYIDMLIGLVIMTASLLCLNQLAGLFAGDNAEFAEMIKQIYRFEAVGAIPLGVNAAVMALLYGFGKTRVTLVMNFCRVFLFRVPVLWALQQFTDLGNVSAGIVMAVSNVASGVLAAVVGVIEIRRICNTYDVRYFGGERKN